MAHRSEIRLMTEYAELHAHSAFSFLDGASLPEDLVRQAVDNGLWGLAITDHNGLYGVARFAEAAEGTPLRTIFGAELTVRDDWGNNEWHLLVLARGQRGYHRLSAAITDAHLAGTTKNDPQFRIEHLTAAAHGEWIVLTGCRRGPVRRHLPEHELPTEAHTAAAAAALDDLVKRFGADNVVVELFQRGMPLDDPHNDLLYRLAQERSLRVVATGNVHYATAERYPLATAFAALHERRTLDDADGYLPPGPSQRLRSPAEMHRIFARYPGAVSASVDIARECAFPLTKATPRLPKPDLPPGETPMSRLRELVTEAIPRVYPGATEATLARIHAELESINDLDFPGYFLIVHDIVQFARSRGILCQGRGSAANSAVCYLLGITAVDSIAYNLPFERFLSALRNEPPDIDVDFDSDRREEVIQYVFATYGRRNAAQVANVISYRPKNAIRDMGRVLGYSTGQLDSWSRSIERWRSLRPEDSPHIPPLVTELAAQTLTLPRHLGIHSGGMVLTEQPVGEVVPIEHARMPGRTVLQWDKDDCAYMGLVKFDLLGLGMLGAINHVFELAREELSEDWELGTVPREEPAVYDTLCRADTIGIFQVESRAQMGLLPRLQPRRFYDIVVQIAMVRPGPIQGGSVHPFVKRRTGEEPIRYAHPKLIPALERTLGVPIFQEQLMQMAMAVGGCSAQDADLIRRSIGSKRGIERLATIKEKFYAGMAANGITGADADGIFGALEAFANFGFAESHSIAFSLLVYVSAWLRLHYPAFFLVGLLRSQPMGFYAPATLVSDAERHGVDVRIPCIHNSGIEAMPEHIGPDFRHRATGRDSCLQHNEADVPPFDYTRPDDSAQHRRDGAFAVRLGLTAVGGIGTATAARIVAERELHGQFRDMPDLVRRCDLTLTELEALATAGAFDVFGLTRREALWEAGRAAHNRAEYLAGLVASVQPPLFDDMTDWDSMVQNRTSTGISPGDHPLRHHRESLRESGILSNSDLRTAESNRRISVAGIVTHRQRPGTAKGITFLNLEDETGVTNILCSPGLWTRYRRVARESAALVVRGILQRTPHGAITIVADALEPFELGVGARSRDFR